VLTRGYDRLLTAIGLPGTDITTQRVLNGLVSLELDQRAQEATSGGGAKLGTVIPADQGGGCTVEIVFDPPGHVRLPINDDCPVPRHMRHETPADLVCLN
jgi:hypothetical protein